MTDEQVWKADEICAHPNINTETLQIKQENFHKIFKETGHIVKIIELPYIEESVEV